MGGAPSALLTVAAGKFESGVQRIQSSTTGSFAVVQFNSSQKPFVAFGIVPMGVTGCNEELLFSKILL